MTSHGDRLVFAKVVFFGRLHNRRNVHRRSPNLAPPPHIQVAEISGIYFFLSNGRFDWTDRQEGIYYIYIVVQPAFGLRETKAFIEAFPLTWTQLASNTDVSRSCSRSRVPFGVTVGVTVPQAGCGACGKQTVMES